MFTGKLQRYACFAVIAFVIAGCSDPNTIGIDVVPNATGGNTVFTDTLTIETEIIKTDSLISDGTVALYNLAGSYYDPVFGISTAAFYTQCRLPNNTSSFSFGTTPVLDSIVLTLAYADFYGESTSQQQFEVYRLDESLDIDTTYYSNRVMNVSDLLFSGMVTLNPGDSVNLGGVNKAPHLRLKLDDALGNEFVDPANASSFTDVTSFLNFFKGLYVKTADATVSGSRGIASFNLQVSMSKMTVYYSNASADSLTANFEFNASCPRFNQYKHDYSAAVFGNTFPVFNSPNLYVQSMSGVKTRLRIPGLKALVAEGPIAINKAELIVPATDYSAYKNHDALFALGVDSTGKETIIPDILESTSFYGGTFNAATQQYVFNMHRYVQQLLLGEINIDGIDYYLSLVGSGAPVNARRTIIPGPLSPDKKIKLNLTYSKLR